MIQAPSCRITAELEIVKKNPICHHRSKTGGRRALNGNRSWAKGRQTRTQYLNWEFAANTAAIPRAFKVPAESSRASIYVSLPPQYRVPVARLRRRRQAALQAVKPKGKKSNSKKIPPTMPRPIPMVRRGFFLRLALRV